MAVNDSGLQYRHPHVTSHINSEEVIYDSTESATSFFYAAVTEKGEDNKIKRLSSSEEFIAKYGQPNMKKYGQASYNIVNLLNSGAEVYMLRVLPNDATYAHSFLNVQTLVNPNNAKKSIKDINGSIVNIDDINIRLCTSYAEMQSTSASALRTELTMERQGTTIDGYSDNLLLCLYPIGRGKAYNNMAFRLTLNTSYDEMYDFRVYTLEVITYDEFNTSNIVEGPFYVALDPEAMGVNNESMFIEDVLTRYSSTVRCLFNEKVYDRLTTLINPYVNPAHIDILSGQSRIISGQAETFYCEDTKKNEDVHVTIQKYDMNGNKALENGYQVLNYADPNDKAVQTSVDINNALKSDIYRSYSRMLGDMSDVLGKIIQKQYNATIGSIATVEGETINGGTYNDAITAVATNLNASLQQIFQNGDLPENGVNTQLAVNNVFTSTGSTLSKAIEDLSSANGILDASIENAIREIEKLLPFLRMIKVTTGTTTTTPVIEANIDAWKEMLNSKEAFVYETTNVYRNILDLSDQLIYAETAIDVETKAELMINIFSEYLTILYPTIALLNNKLNKKLNCYYTEDTAPGDTKHEPFAEKLGELNVLVDAASGIIATLSNQYLTADFINDLLVGTQDDEGNEQEQGLASIIADTFAKSIEFIQAANPVFVLSVDYAIAQEHSTLSVLDKGAVGKSVAAATAKYSEDYLDAGASNATKQAIINDARLAIEEETVKLENKKSQVLRSLATTSTSICKFSGGTDGEIDDDNTALTATQRQINIDKLLVRAYKGLIDPDVTNEKVMKFKYLLDANFSLDVKNAMVSLVREIRQDLFCWLDTEFCNSAEEAVSWRVNKFPISSHFVGIFTQDMISFDEFQGKDTKVALSYFLAKKIPQHATQYGLHYPMAGSRRGVIDGYKENSVSFFPNKLYREQLYNRQVNYLETDGVNTKLGSQLTADSTNSPLSNINNVLTLLDIKRNVEYMAETVVFEFNDEETKSSFQQELNSYLDKYVNNRACETISATVYASDYDKQQKILRVTVTIKFNDVIERVILNFDVTK